MLLKLSVLVLSGHIHFAATPTITNDSLKFFNYCTDIEAYCDIISEIPMVSAIGRGVSGDYYVVIKPTTQQELDGLVDRMCSIPHKSNSSFMLSDYRIFFGANSDAALERYSIVLDCITKNPRPEIHRFVK